ncbi:hypothetical protein M0805_004195 [Coniferiporia weirii]|nr:hypothetical protein M0805_004195 [Coniferiporia weirii]
MSVYYYEPFFSISDISRLIDDAFSSHSSLTQQLTRATGTSTNTEANGQRSLAQGFQPRLDIHESGETGFVTATFELPGLKREDVTIDVQENRLVVSGTQTVAKDAEDAGYVHRERRIGRFSRTLPLPAGTKPDDIKAKLEDGLLTISFPKASPEQAPQRIAIA